MFFFFKQKTAYEMRISDWSSDVCSSDLRRRHDQAALALTDRRDEVDDPRRHVGRVIGPLEGELLVGEERGQVLEAVAVAGLLRVDAVDRVDPQQRRVLLVAQGGTAGADDVVALAAAELPGLLDRDVAVVTRRKEARNGRGACRERGGKKG